MAANSDMELEKMVRSFRVSDLQSLLIYAGRNKNGKKTDLQVRALDLVKLRSAAIDMKIREIHQQKFSQSGRGGHPEPELYTMPQISGIGTLVPNAPSYSASQRPMRSGHQRRTPAIPGGYMPNVNKHIVTSPSHMSDRYEPQYPMNPDVRFKDLPFYDNLGTLLRPTSLITLPNDRFKENEYVFYFLPQQVLELQSSTDVQVQLRICFLDSSCDQEDELPPSICLKINHVVFNMPNPIPTNRPGAEPRRPKKPVDITNLTKKTDVEPNVVTISWASVAGKPYVLGIFLVRKQNSAVLIRRLKANGVRNPDHTTATIKEKLCQDRDSEIATMSLRGSLICPLGKIKMKLPSRALTCTHLQCFDATLYLQMNEKKPKWICPVCDKPALFKNLAIDGLFLDIICKAPSECTEVQFHEDGSWTPVIQVKKPTEISDASFDSTPKNPPKAIEAATTAKPKRPVEVIDLDSDSDTEDSWAVLPPKKKPFKPSGDMSPVLLESPEDTQQSQDLKMEPFNPFLPSTSKTEPTCSKTYETSVPPKNNNIPGIPEKSSLAPLPDALDIEIDSSDVDCILGDIPSTSTAGPSSGYDNVSTPNSPEEIYIPPADPFMDNNGVEVLPNKPQDATRHFTNFDLFSLIQPNQEENFDYPGPEDDDASPDVINID